MYSALYSEAMNKTQTASQKLAAHTAAQSTATLVEAFCLTGDLLPGLSAEDAAPVFISRGAIMDELERRNPEAFGAWIDDAVSDDAGLRAAFGL